LDIATAFNVDEVFYSIEGKVRVFTINNILISAVGHKTIYELKDATTHATRTMTERDLTAAVDGKRFVKTIDEVRTYLANRAEEIIADTEKSKTNFLKNKLNQTLHGNKRKANTTIEGMKRKLGLDDEDDEDYVEDGPNDDGVLAETELTSFQGKLTMKDVILNGLNRLNGNE